MSGFVIVTRKFIDEACENSLDELRIKRAEEYKKYEIDDHPMALVGLGLSDYRTRHEIAVQLPKPPLPFNKTPAEKLIWIEVYCPNSYRIEGQAVRHEFNIIGVQEGITECELVFEFTIKTTSFPSTNQDLIPILATLDVEQIEEYGRSKISFRSTKYRLSYRFKAQPGNGEKRHFPMATYDEIKRNFVVAEIDL